MTRLNKIPTLLALATLSALCATAQPKVASTGGNSPHETTSAVVDGNRVTITYGRPMAKGRKVWGTLVPWEKAWRAGSDEATLLITEKPIVLGGTEIPAGAYTLYVVPSENGTSKLAISKRIGKWGIPVDESQDLARVDLKKEPLAQTAEQFTIAVDKTGVIKMMWENTQYSVAFALKK